MKLPVCTSNHFLHSITASYYSAINFSNQVPLTIINWSAPFHPCFTGKSDLIVAVIFAAYLLHIHQFSSRFWTSHRIKKEKPQNRSSEVCNLFELYFSCEIIISLITPNAYFTAFFDRLSVTRLLRIFSQAFSRCFIISQLLELYMLGFSGEVKVADCSDHLLSVDNMNLFHII